MAGYFDSLIKNAYGSIGRSGFGSAPNQIDQGGFDYWKGQLESGAVQSGDFMDTFNTAVDGYMKSVSRDDPLKAHILNYRSNSLAGEGDPTVTVTTPSPAPPPEPPQNPTPAPTPTPTPTPQPDQTNDSSSSVDDALYDAIMTALDAQSNTIETQGNMLDLFQQDLYPRSGSENTSQSTSESVSRNTSNSGNVSSGRSANQSGLDWDNPFVQEMTGLISTAVNNLPQNIEDWTQAAADRAEAEARLQAKNLMPGILSSLQKRGILNSSISENVLADVLGGIAENAAGKNYDAAMEAAKMKKDVPTMLGQLAELGRQSSGSSINWSTGSSSSKGSSTSTSNSNSSGSSFSEDPLAPYEAIMNMFLGMGA